MIFRGLCTSCAHYDHDDERDLRVCTAFPDGVPDEIVRLGFDHRKPYPGDNGIRFVPDGPIDVEKIEYLITPVISPGVRLAQERLDAHNNPAH